MAELQLDAPAKAEAPGAGEYNDYASSTQPTAKRWSNKNVFMVLLGILSAFFFPATGGAFVQQYGAQATWISLGISFVLLTLLIIPIARMATRYGLTAEMITRGSGFGFRGSAIPSVIYAFTFTIYAALEGQILASALKSVWDLPIGVYFVIVGLLFIPLTWWGMSQLTWTMWLTLPVYLVLLVVALARADDAAPHAIDQLFTHTPVESVVGIVAFVGVMAAISGTIGLNPMEFADYMRFMPAQSFARSIAGSVVAPVALMMFVAFPLGMYLTLATGSADPGVYFVTLLGPGLGLLFAWISQTRVNMTNIYVGSIAVSSISVRLFNRNPGRLASIGIMCVLSIVLMFGDVLGHLLQFLAWDGIFLLSWVGCVVADIVIVKGVLKLGPADIRYEKKDLPGFNAAGLTGIAVAVVVGTVLFFQNSMPIVSALAPYIAFLVAAAVHVSVAVATKGRTYYPRTVEP
jgi:cytosine permease